MFILGMALLILALVLIHYQPEGYMSYGDMTNGWNGSWWEDPQHAPVPLTGRGIREEIGARRAEPGNPHVSKTPMLYGIPQDLQPIRTEGFATYGSKNAPLRYGGPTDLRAIEGMDAFSSKNKNPMLYGIPQDLKLIKEGFASNNPAPLKYQGPSDLYAFRDIKNKVKGVVEPFATCGASELPRRNGAAISEGFATHATDARRMPVCVNRSTDAQSLLARFAHVDTAEADELRLLMSKLCCMEADIAAPGAGTYRTLNLQFRTSQDTEPPVAIVSRCLVGALNKRDTELIIEKFKVRGHELIRELCEPVDEATAEFDTVLKRLELTMRAMCKSKSIGPAGPRDLGYWESESDLSQYDGFSAEPK